MSDIINDNQNPEQQNDIADVVSDVNQELTGEATAEQVEGEGTENQENDKPWKRGKQETPSWARKRFREYSSKNKELKAQNDRLQEQINQIHEYQKSNRKELTREDFPDEESYFDHKVEQKLQKTLAERDKSNIEKRQARDQYYQARSVYNQNLDNARKHLEDYDEVIQNGDSDIQISQNVLEKLEMSPAAPYVKYAIAGNEELSETLKSQIPMQRKNEIIAKLHDECLDWLHKEQNENKKPVNAAKPDVKENIKTSVPKAPPKGPPKVQGQATKSISHLKGEEYVKARLKQMNRL